MIKVGINGIGRIGKAVLRANLKHEKFEIVALNDINPDVGNIAYQLNFDTTYGSLTERLVADDGHLVRGGQRIAYSHFARIDQVPWAAHGVDIVVDASGVYDNVLHARNLLAGGQVRHIMITHSPKEVDFTMVLGANEHEYRPGIHRLTSSSICDATALAPVLREVNETFGIESGYITTLHPWLNYQNLSDGPASSWSHPGEIYHHYALGRASVGNIIPKPTSAVDATCKVLPSLSTTRIGSFSYRTPTSIVGSADITLVLAQDSTTASVVERFTQLEKEQRWKVFHNNQDPLVSLDFCGCEYSAVVDHRWTEVLGGRLLKLVLWYDNEWGYANRVIDQVEYIAQRVG